VVQGGSGDYTSGVTLVAPPHLETPAVNLLVVLLVLILGAALVFSATRATANVDEGSRFVRWMVAVFLCFLALAALPVLVSF